MFLRASDIAEVMYGGSARGGKSFALLASALQYVHEPEYRALILRKTFADLSLPGSLMDVAQQWLAPTNAKWSGQNHTWTFPSGATLTFGYLDTPNDKYRYQGSQFHYIAFDELTQFREDDYTYLFSRLTRTSGSKIPIRMRSASNPGGIGHDWVKERFIQGRAPGRLFIPAGLQDNPHVDATSYIASLGNLDSVTRAQLLLGDWDVSREGSLFRREWFPIVDDYPRGTGTVVRRWDLAATKDAAGTDPDYTAGALLVKHQGRYWVADVQRFRGSPHEVEKRVRQTAEMDGRNVVVRMEQEPGSAGVGIIDHYARTVLDGFNFQGVPSTGSKISRAGPVAAAAEAGNVMLVRGHWNSEFLAEVSGFPDASHDDQVDAVSGALADMATNQGNVSRFYAVARGNYAGGAR